MADNRSRTLGGVRPSGWIPHLLSGSSSTPRQSPGIVSNVPGQLPTSSRPSTGGREHGGKRSSGDRIRSGSRFLQPSFSGGKSDGRLETRDRLISPQRVRSSDPFKMETAASVLLSVREGDFLASVDLKDAYFQIPVHWSSRKWLRFTSDGTVHQFKVLCFGLSAAPQVFTRVFAGVSAWAHSRGISLLWYLDDWLILASLETRARQYVRELLSLSLPWDSDKREVRSRAVAICRVPWDDHRHSCCPGLPHLSAGGEVPFDSGMVLDAVRPSRQALAGVVGTHVIAGETGTSRETSDALATVASEVSVILRD